MKQKLLTTGLYRPLMLLLVMVAMATGRAWGQSTYEKATSISLGDIVVFVTEDAGKELTSISTTSTKYGIGSSYSDTPDGSYSFVVVAGNSSNTYAFKNGDNYLCWTSGNSLNVSSTLNDNSSWFVTISGEGANATIKNVADDNRQIWWNNDSPRFACYTGKTANQTYNNIQLYKLDGNVTPKCATPTFSPAAGEVFEGTEVTISTSTMGATIYYTMGDNPADPTTSSTQYTDPIVINAETTIKAIAVFEGYDNSDVGEAAYTIKPVISGYNINFESELERYVDWEFTNT